MVLPCSLLVQALGGAAGNTGSVSPHLQLLHPVQGPLCAVQAVTLCCGVIKSWWSTEPEPSTPTGERYLCTPCTAHPSFLTQGLTLSRRLLLSLFCCVVVLVCFFFNVFQTNKLITPSSCRDVSNHIRGAVLPNRCCQDSSKSPAALGKHVQMQGLIRNPSILAAAALQPLQPSLILLPERDLWSTLAAVTCKALPWEPSRGFAKSDLTALGAYVVLHGAHAMWT